MELKYKYPKSVIEEIRNEYKFLNIIGVRCNLRSDSGFDYSVDHEDGHSSPCREIYCSNCIFGRLKTQEELKKAKEYWYSKTISEKINDIELLLL